MVYVLDNTGKAIMPTERHGKVRRLLRKGLAHVVRLQPFTIQLDYENKGYTQEVCLGVDAGSIHIGLSATTDKKELFASEITMRNDIVEKIASRKELRNNRKHRNTRYRKEKFSNRKRKQLFAPSIEYKIKCHLYVIRFVNSILPISKTIIEVAQFDLQKIKNSEITGTEYQNGEQTGFWNVREYVLARDKHQCQHCKGKSGDKILNVHHLESRKTGGNSLNNLITLCRTCHEAYHRHMFDLNIKRGIPFRDASAMNIMRWELYKMVKDCFPNVHITYGYITKHTRIENNINKTHYSDAFCISNNTKATRLGYYIKMRLFQRHTRSLHVFNPKKRGIRRSRVASHWIGNSKFQRYDCVEWNGMQCFIFGSTNGRLYLRDINGVSVTSKNSISVKDVKFIRRSKNKIIKKMEDVSEILYDLSVEYE